MSVLCDFYMKSLMVRVIICCVGTLVVGWLVGWLVDWFVGWLVGGLVGW